MPRCEIVPHPNRQNVEYCRVCGEWRHLSDVGNELPGAFGIAVAIAIVLMILMSLLNEFEQQKLMEPNYHRTEYWGYKPH
jgi:hypothetical protein